MTTDTTAEVADLLRQMVEELKRIDKRLTAVEGGGKMGPLPGAEKFRGPDRRE